MAKVAVVTGGNQGLGFALVAGLCERLGPGGVVYLAARDPERGHAALKDLEAAGLHAVLHLLDVRSDESVEALAAHVRDAHGGVDIVLSNAAARIDKATPQEAQVRTFVDTNNGGTLRMIRWFAPVLRDGARFVVVASAFGSLRSLPAAHHGAFDVERGSLADVEEVMRRYVEAVEAGRHVAEGWPAWINVPSKVAQVAAMKVFARDFGPQAQRRGILVNAVCPGLVDTAASRPWFDDMSKAQSPAAAAVDVLWSATLPPGASSPYGELVQHRRVLPWR